MLAGGFGLAWRLAGKEMSWIHGIAYMKQRIPSTVPHFELGYRPGFHACTALSVLASEAQ
jgi:hypothetical protein